MFISNILSNNVYVYKSREKLGTMGVSSRTGDEEDFANYRSISLIFRCNNITISIYYLHNPT